MSQNGFSTYINSQISSTWITFKLERNRLNAVSYFYDPVSVVDSLRLTYSKNLWYNRTATFTSFVLESSGQWKALLCKQQYLEIRYWSLRVQRALHNWSLGSRDSFSHGEQESEESAEGEASEEEDGDEAKHDCRTEGWV